MRFGRVEGVVTPVGDGTAQLHLVVWLETGRSVQTVRDETLAPLRPIATYADLVWHADQWTQETIGAILALEGWEAIGVGEPPEDDPHDPGQLPRSPSYAVRNLTWG